MFTPVPPRRLPGILPINTLRQSSSKIVSTLALMVLAIVPATLAGHALIVHYQKSAHDRATSTPGAQPSRHPDAPRPHAPTNPETLSATSRAHLSEGYGKLPLRFEANEGQLEAGVKYFSRGPGYNLLLAGNEAVINLNSAAPIAQSRRPQVPDRSQQVTTSSIHMRLAGSNPNPRITGEDELVTKTNYFTGDDPAKWQTNIRNFSQVRSSEVYPGVDLVYHGSQHQLEYDLIVAPGADSNQIRLSFSGAQSVRIDENGEMALNTAAGVLVQHKPVVYQELSGVRKEIASRYVKKLDGEIGFEVASYDRTRPLVVDPSMGLTYSTYLGGSANDEAFGVAVDALGSAYVTGFTASIDFPTSSGPQQSANKGGVDAFVAKLSPDGSQLIYSTYFGGSGSDIATAIAVDSAGSAYITGETTSSDFPVFNPFQGALRGTQSAFVVKLGPDGLLAYSTYLGGSSAGDEGYGIAVDSSGAAYVTGVTSSTNFPLAKEIQATLSGSTDAFVTELNPQGNGTFFSTYLGGSGDDAGSGIAVDPPGNVYVAGVTSSTNFPTKNPLQATNGGGTEAFVAKLNAGGASLSYATYLGGRGTDAATAIAVASTGEAFVTGTTTSGNFPTTSGAFQTALAGTQNAFVAEVNGAGTSLTYSTYLGGNGSDTGNGIAVDNEHNAYVTGVTTSSNFPLSIALQASNAGGQDAFVTKINFSGNTLLYSTYLGGSGNDSGNAIAVDLSGAAAYVAGNTTSSNFPVANAIQGANAGSNDAFVSKLTASTTYTVTNTNDSGTGSLRQAILNANSNPGTDVITFNIPGSGVQTIAPASFLPVITDPVIIDGFTQPGASAGTPTTSPNLLIQISGTNAGAAVGIEIDAGSSIVRGLVINNFSNSGEAILLAGGLGGNTILGNFIGTDPTGTTSAANAFGIVASNSSSNTIGGAMPGARNLISGNQNEGVFIDSVGNVVVGNYIGTDVTGTAGLGNGGEGVFISLGTGNMIGSTLSGGGNVISRNVTGIAILGTGNGGANFNIVLGNLIGTDVTGTNPLGNSQDGIDITSGAQNNTIGGVGPGAANVISGNVNTGITIFSANTSGNVVLGNLIGTSASGASAVPNTGTAGVFLASNANGNRIGVGFNGGNVIAGNTGPGIELGSSSNSIVGNTIGNLVNDVRLPNNVGIFATPAGNNNIIGSNNIGYNSSYGVEIDGGTGDSILTNTFIANFVFPIVLFQNGNNNQQSPSLTSVYRSGGGSVVNGAVTGVASNLYTIEVYENSIGDCRTLTFLGTTNVTTDANGHATFSLPVSPVASGQFVAATATDSNGNTSMFSNCQVAAASLLTQLSPLSGPEPGGNQITITGAGFQATGAGTTSVMFAGISAINVNVVSDTEVTATVPAGVGEVPVTVVNGNGSSTVLSYTYIPPPLANAEPAVLSTFGGGNQLIVFPRPDLNLPAPTENIVGLPSGANPQGMSFIGSDHVLVGDSGHGRFFVVQVSTGAVQQTITTNVTDGGGTVAVAPNFQYALTGDSSQLAVIQAPFSSSSSVLQVTLPGQIGASQTEGIVFDPAGRAFVYQTNGISVLDPPYTSVAFNIPASNPNNGSLAITPDGNTLLATDGTSGLVEIFSAPFSQSSTPVTLNITGAFLLDGIQVTPDGTTALVVGASQPQIFSIKAPFNASSQVHQLALPPDALNGSGLADIAISADSQFAIATGGDNGTSPAVFLRKDGNNGPAGEDPSFAVFVPGGRGQGVARFQPPGLAPGLFITKSAPAVIRIGATITYTITYGNSGSAPASGVVIQDPLPSNTTLISASNGGSQVGNSVVWNIGTLPAGTVDQTLSFTLLTGTGTAISGKNKIHPYDFSNSLVNDNYTIQASGITPVTGPPVITAIIQTYTISGKVADNMSNPLTGATLTLSGLLTEVTQADAGGNYSFAGLPAGNYILTPTFAGYTFVPANAQVNPAAGQAVNFKGTLQVHPPPPLTLTPNTLLTEPPGTLDTNVKVAQQNNQVTITPLSGVEGEHFNGAVSNAFDFTNARAAVDMVQPAGGGAETHYSIGSDANNFYRFRVNTLGALATSEKGNGIHSYDEKTPVQLIFEVNSGGGKSVLKTINYDPVQDRFLRFRHDPTKAQGAPLGFMVFETSPCPQSGSCPPTNLGVLPWVEQARTAIAKSVTALAVELSAGTTAPLSSTGPAVFDTLQVAGASTISWSNPADITYGTPLGAAQLNATSNVPGVFTYNPPAGTVLPAGAGQRLSVTFTPTDDGHYNVATASVMINVNKATPVINWATPAAITQGTALGAAQLNATANVPGTFAYNPPAGTVLAAGNNQKLSVTFTPTDTADYNTAQASVFINVVPAQTSVTTPVGNNVQVQVNGVAFTFATVTTAGMTTAMNTSTGAAGQLPVGYTLVPASVAYNLSTTAAFNGTITTCFNVSGVSDPAVFGQLAVLHNENGTLVDRTSSRNFGTKQVCGQTTSLSPFVIAEAATTVQFTAATEMVSEGGKSITLTVNRTGDTTKVVSVNYATTDGTASERSKYIAALGTLEFGAGESTKTVTVLIVDEAYVEGNKTFNVILSSPVGMTLGAIPATVVTIVDNDTVPPTSNPIDGAQYFAGQQYLDFYGRLPDASGLSFWTGQVNSNSAPCGQITDATAKKACLLGARAQVSRAFFLSIEFQQTGYFVIRFYEESFGREPTLREFLADAGAVGRGVVVGQAGYQQVLAQNKANFANEWITRPDFVARYAALSNTDYVNALFTNAGAEAADEQPLREQLIAGLNSGSETRATVLPKVADSATVYNKQYNPAFVLLQYFGYLRRNPSDLPDKNLNGYNFWLSKMNQFTNPGEDARDPNVALLRVTRAQMVEAFIDSMEYRQRFGPP